MARNQNEDLPKAKINSQNLKQFLGIYKFMTPYRMFFVGGLLCLVLSSVIILAFPFLTGKLIDISLGKKAQFEIGEFSFALDNIDQIAVVLISILLIQSIFSFFRVYFFAQVSEKSMADIRIALYQKLMTLPLLFYDSRRVGELNSRITADVAVLQSTFSLELAEFVRQITILVAGLGILFVKTPQLTFFMLATIPILVLAAMFFGKSIRKFSKETQDKLAQANTIVEETLQSISMVKAFTNERYEVKRYKNALEDTVKTALLSANYRGIFVSFIILAIFGGIVAVIWYGAGLVQKNEISIGDLTSFVIYTMFIGGSIGGLGDMYGQLQRAIGASERIREILDMESEIILEKTNPAYQVSGNIEFKNIRFSYPSRTEIEVLKEVSFHIQKGEKVALVGQSGAGKSTMIQLLMQFYQVSGGNISLDGKNIQDYDLQSFRSHVGIVPQEVILFGGTIGENIAYGKPSATETEIIEAATQANAWNFIQQFPDGLKTIVGERGIKLSGGQRQRIAIARAILKNPSILILDEATSSLDAESEHLVQEALEKLMKNRTTIIIAHRLATIREANRIYVLDQGKIIEQGTHEQLLALEGTYHNLVRLQMKEK